MQLHEALLQSECPICLQPLNFAVQPPPSRPASPLTTSHTASSPTTHPSSSSSSSSPHSLILLPSAPLSEGEENRDFRITFAPGVYGSDAADPWHPSFELPTHSSAPTGSLTTDADLNPLSSASPSSRPTTDESASGVAVLPCGHLLHYLCAMQLCEYAAHPSCPVCRMKLTSTADLILFHPRARAPARVATPVAVTVAATGSGGSRKGRENANTPRGTGWSSSSKVREQQDDENSGSNSVMVLGDESETQLTDVQGDDETVTSASAHGTAPASPLGDLADMNVTTPSPPHLPASGTPGSATSDAHGTQHTISTASRTTSGSSIEDEILILGARQLPPAQAYAELLLRSTASWSDRAAVLKTRVSHLEKSQQQLQRDCAELETTLLTARRRREVLLNVPAGGGGPHGNGADSISLATSASFDRLRELRRLCDETRTAMAAATAELAATTREGAEVRRQMDKYGRKLSRLEAGDGVEEPEEKRGRVEHVK